MEDYGSCGGDGGSDDDHDHSPKHRHSLMFSPSQASTLLMSSSLSPAKSPSHHQLAVSHCPFSAAKHKQ